MTQLAAGTELAVLTSIQSHLALILFDTQGIATWVNDNFARAMGYQVQEIVGMHHRIFCAPEFAASREYEAFWANLRKGKAFQDKIQRVSKDGRHMILEATYMPVMANGRVEAIVKVATDITERETLLQSGTHELMAMVEEMTANTDSVLQATERIVEKMNDLTRESETVKQYVKSIESVLTFVQNIASQSQLLGLNAAIEAARAGEHGLGFAVVASEVRKMADSSNKSADEISAQLSAISRSVTAIIEKIVDVTGLVTTNSAAVHDLKNAYDHIATTTEKLATSI